MGDVRLHGLPISASKATMLEDKLIEILSEFDGRATTIPGEAEARFGADPKWLDVLVALSTHSEGRVQSGATWLLKSAFEQGRRLDEIQTGTLLDSLSDVQEWSAVLHICQSTDYLTISKKSAPGFADWLEANLSHKKPFIRAWSMNALCHLAWRHPAYVPRAISARDAASADQAASVRARARNAKLPG